MLMRLHTVAHRYHHFIDGLRGRSRESVLDRWRWAHLSLLCSLHLVVWVMRARYVAKDLPFLYRWSEGFRIVQWCHGYGAGLVFLWYACRLCVWEELDHIRAVRFPLVGSANQKIDIFKITCKVLLCVGVGLIKKTLAWQ